MSKGHSGDRVWPFVLGGAVLVVIYIPGNLSLAVLLWLGEASVTGRVLGDRLGLWSIVVAVFLNVATYLVICGITLARVRGSVIRRQRAVLVVWFAAFAIEFAELVAAFV